MTLTTWFELSIAVLSVFPAILLYNHYKKTGISSFLYFTIAFISVSIIELTLVFRDLTSLSALSEQVGDFTTIVLYTIFFSHALRIKWVKSPIIFLVTNILFFAVNLILILFYSPVVVSQREFSLFMNMYRYGDTTNSFGVKIGDNLIQANGYSFLLFIYGFYVTALFLYVYITTPPVSKNVRVHLVRKIWILIGFFVIFSPLMALGHLVGLWTGQLIFGVLSNLIAMLLIIFITLRYPESLLISESEIIRSGNLYTTVQNLNSVQEIKNFGMPQLVEYIKSLPTDLLLRHNIIIDQK